MTCRWPRTTLAAAVAVLWAASAVAQTPSWNVEVASGVTATTGDISNRLTKGWNLGIGAGYEINHTWELNGLFTVNGLGVSDQALQTLHVPDGSAAAGSRSGSVKAERRCSPRCAITTRT